jgi:hypothetical protein
MLPTPSAEPLTTFQVQTCIEPDRIALLARDVSEVVRGGFPRAFIHFDGAVPGQLLFSVRTRLARAELMAFSVEIVRREDGFTKLDARIRDDPPARTRTYLPAVASRPLAYEIYKRYARELASALARFDPLSTAVMVEKGQQ